MSNTNKTTKNRKSYDSRDKSFIKCSSCDLEQTAENFRIYYYQPKGSNVIEKRRVSTCKICANLRKKIAAGKKRLEEGVLKKDSSSHVSDWIEEVSSFVATK